MPETATSRRPENGSRKWPASGAVTANPTIIITQTMVAAAPRRAGATPPASSTSSEVPAAPTPIPTHRKATAASASPSDEVGGGERGAAGRPDPAKAEQRHAADDPRGAPAAPVRAVAPARAQHLHRVVQGDQKARHEGGQRKFHHHHPVEGGGHQHHDAAQRGLDQAEADDLGQPMFGRTALSGPRDLRPRGRGMDRRAAGARTGLAHHAPPTSGRSAKAATSMPST